MAHSGKTMTFATNIYPAEDDLYYLGTTGQRWIITGELTGNATNITGTLGLDHLTKGDANTALMGQGASTAPAYVSVSPSISITAGTTSNAPKINLSVLGINGTAQELTKATTGVYGATKLSSTLSDSEVLAATPKMVNTLNTKVDGLLAAADALVYKGVRAGAATSSSNTYGALTPAANCGDVYKVSTEGYINGLYVEVGDMLICTTDGTEAATASTYTSIREKWNIIQTSEGSVSTTETSVTDGHIVLFSGTTGKFIKTSSKSLTTTAPSSSSADTTIPTSKAVWSTVSSAINALDVSAVGGGTGEYISKISETDGKISATKSTTTVGNEWTAGSTNGPQLTTTVNGITGSAVTIPSASSSASGIVTTTTQTFAGDKTFSGNIYTKNIYHYNANNITDGSWVTEASGTANSGNTQGVLGKAVLELGNNIAQPNAGSSGGLNNSQGFLRLYSNGADYGELTGLNSWVHANSGLSIRENAVGIMFRPTNSDRYTHISYQTNGNEALVAATQNAVTSFIFVNGESSNNIAASRWQSLTGASGAGNAPGLQIKQNCVSIGELIPSGTNATYKLNVNGTSNFKNDMSVTGSITATVAVRSPKLTLVINNNNSYVDKAYLQYNTTDNSIDFVFV